MFNFLFLPLFWQTVLASSTSVMLATLAANIMNKTGIFNLSIEGNMLICALAGVILSALTQNLFLACILTVLIGIFISFIFGYFSLVMKANMNACGVGINLLASGGTVFVLYFLTGSKANSSSLKSLTFPTLELPIIKNIPILGTIISKQNTITYIAWFIVIFISFLLYKTRIGVNIRAVGKNPKAAQSLGINVLKYQFISLMICGISCAFGGMYLSMGALKSFTAQMTAQRGYMALALDAMSQGNPIAGFFSSLLYGFSDTITVYLQLYSKIDLKLIGTLPYLFILIVLLIAQIVRKMIKK